jgi:hypothetical protein
MRYKKKKKKKKKKRILNRIDEMKILKNLRS